MCLLENYSFTLGFCCGDAVRDCTQYSPEVPLLLLVVGELAGGHKRPVTHVARQRLVWNTPKHTTTQSGKEMKNVLELGFEPGAAGFTESDSRCNQWLWTPLFCSLSNRFLVRNISVDVGTRPRLMSK